MNLLTAFQTLLFLASPINVEEVEVDPVGFRIQVYPYGGYYNYPPCPYGYNYYGGYCYPPGGGAYFYYGPGYYGRYYGGRHRGGHHRGGRHRGGGHHRR